jgi:hypothetical protein
MLPPRRDVGFVKRYSWGSGPQKALALHGEQQSGWVFLLFAQSGSEDLHPSGGTSLPVVVHSRQPKLAAHAGRAS